MPATVHSLLHQGPFSAREVSSAAGRLFETQKQTSQLAFLFLSPDYLPHLEECIDILRVDGRILDICGCTAPGLIGGGLEKESTSGFSLLALSDPASTFHIFPLPETRPIPGAVAQSAHSWTVLIDPYNFPAENWLGEWNASRPHGSLVGGLAGGNDAETTAVFHNSKRAEGGVLVGVEGHGIRILPVLSQGCRPIGEPLTVTKAENNVLFALGSQPAYEVLESAFQTLTDDEKSTARGNLFAGLAGTEYVEEFQPGDFLIRNILGADPDSGAVVIGGLPRVGQTLQYQYRDRDAASRELQQALRLAGRNIKQPLGSLIFSCLGRGKKFFQTPNHDVSALQHQFGEIPHAGFFCNGEIGPVHSVNSITSYTAAFGFICHAK